MFSTGAVGDETVSGWRSVPGVSKLLSVVPFIGDRKDGQDSQLLELHPVEREVAGRVHEAHASVNDPSQPEQVPLSSMVIPAQVRPLSQLLATWKHALETRNIDLLKACCVDMDKTQEKNFKRLFWRYKQIEIKEMYILPNSLVLGLTDASANLIFLPVLNNRQQQPITEKIYMVLCHDGRWRFQTPQSGQWGTP